MKFLYTDIYFLYHATHFFKKCGFWATPSPWAVRWREGSCWGSLDLSCLLSCPLSSPLLRKWVPCPSPSYLQTNRNWWSFLAPSICFISSFHVLALLAFQGGTQRTQQGASVKGLHERQSVLTSFSATCFSAVNFYESDKEEIIQGKGIGGGGLGR